MEAAGEFGAGFDRCRVEAQAFERAVPAQPVALEIPGIGNVPGGGERRQHGIDAGLVFTRILHAPLTKNWTCILASNPLRDG